MDEAKFQQLLDLIYGAAIDAALWPGVLGRLADLMDSHGAVIIHQNEESGLGEGIRAHPNPEATELYYGYYATRNVFLQNDNARAALMSYRPGVLTDEHKLPKDVLVRSEYYNDFMRRFDIHSVLMFRLAVENMDTVVLNLNRSKRRGCYDNADIHFANILLPHLSRAFRMSQKIASTRAAEPTEHHGRLGRVAPILTAREMECIGLLVRGHSDRRIAGILGISEPTVRFHLGNARNKSGAVSRTHMAALAVAQGYVPL